MSDLLREAIADAKQLKKVALENAKTQLEEAFMPQVQSIVSNKLKEEMEDEEEEEEMTYEEEEEDIPVDDELPEDEEEEIPIDDEEDLEEEDEEEIPLDIEDDDEEDLEEEEDDIPLDDEDEELEEIINDLKEEMEDDEEEFDLEDEEDLEEIDLSELFKEEDEEEELDDEEIVDAEEDLEEEEEIPVDDDDEEEDLEELRKENKKLRNFVSEFRKEINEMNLLNSKLLFTNKILRKFQLSENQKIKLVDTFDRTQTLREVKVAYTTLIEAFKTSNVKRRNVNENYASKTIKGTKPSKKIVNDGKDQFNRLRELAGIKNK